MDGSGRTASCIGEFRRLRNGIAARIQNDVINTAATNIQFCPFGPPRFEFGWSANRSTRSSWSIPPGEACFGAVMEFTLSAPAGGVQAKRTDSSRLTRTAKT